MQQKAGRERRSGEQRTGKGRRGNGDRGTTVGEQRSGNSGRIAGRTGRAGLPEARKTETAVRTSGPETVRTDGGTGDRTNSPERQPGKMAEIGSGEIAGEGGQIAFRSGRAGLPAARKTATASRTSGPEKQSGQATEQPGKMAEIGSGEIAGEGGQIAFRSGRAGLPAARKTATASRTSGPETVRTDGGTGDRTNSPERWLKQAYRETAGEKRSNGRP